jgi:hypothetical protein
MMGQPMEPELQVMAAYIPVPPSGQFSQDTSPLAIALYGLGCVISLILMYGLIRKTRRDKQRERRRRLSRRQ